MKKIFNVCISFLVAVLGFGFVPNEGSEIRYADGFEGSTYIGSQEIIIDYAYKVEDTDMIACALPRYYEQSNRLNTCANISGVTLLGYYDKIYDNLIPNFTAGRTIRDRFLFNAQTEAVQAVIDDLYVLMGTNVGGAGTTANGFRNGLQSYIVSKGKNVVYTSIVSSGQPNFSIIEQAVQNEMPMVLFMSGYSLLPIDDFAVSDTRDVLHIGNYSGAHVLNIYGKKNIKYYNASNVLIREDNYLMVATGYQSDALSYIMMNGPMGQLLEGDIVAVS